MIISAIATFSTAVSSGTSSPDWKTKPKYPRRSFERSRSLSAVISSGAPWAALKGTDPEFGRSMPARVCSSVDLPEPEGPMMATDSPVRISKSTAASAKVDP